MPLLPIRCVWNPSFRVTCSCVLLVHSTLRQDSLVKKLLRGLLCKSRAGRSLYLLFACIHSLCVVALLLSNISTLRNGNLHPNYGSLCRDCRRTWCDQKSAFPSSGSIDDSPLWTSRVRYRQRRCYRLTRDCCPKYYGWV